MCDADLLGLHKLVTLIHIEFALVCCLNEAKALCRGGHNRLCTSTGSKVSDDFSFFVFMFMYLFFEDVS
jgi:hypothetical protein